MEGIDGSHPAAPTIHTFLVRAQETQKKRKNPAFNFCAESKDDMIEWIYAFKTAMKSLSWLDSVEDSAKRMSLLSNITSSSSFTTCGSRKENGYT